MFLFSLRTIIADYIDRMIWNDPENASALHEFFAGGTLVAVKASVPSRTYRTAFIWMAVGW